MLAHFILSYSNYLHNDYTNQPFLFIVYSIPLATLTICQNVVKIMKEDNFSIWKAILVVIPGTSNYMLFYCFLSAVNKGIWLLVLIAILGITIPVILDTIIIYCVSEKSKIKVKVYVNDGKVYDLEKRDLIDGNKETVLKIRDAEGKVSQSIVISSEKIDKKEYYRVEKKE